MKNIQAQYQDLLEGKMSPANFMVNVRREFPQWVSPVNTFKDAVNILKSRRILSENVDRQLLNPETAAAAVASEYPTITDQEEALSIIQKMMADAGIPGKEIAGAVNDPDWPSDYITALNHIVKGGDEDGYDPGPGEDENFYRNYDDDDIFAGLYEADKTPLNEAAVWNPNAEAPQEVGYDHVNYRQLMKGMEFELSKEPEITDEALVKAKQKALKNLKKDPNFYRNLLIANVKDVDKMDKTLRDVPVKGDNTVDKANAMKVVAKDVKGNVQDTLGKKEKAKKKDGEGIKQMTQTPKKVKGVEAFETPGKEKVAALKEHLLNEFGSHNSFFSTPQLSVGSRVESGDGKIVGEIVEFDNHTATVKEDGTGKILHVQPNVLKHTTKAPKEAAQAPVKEEDKATKLQAIKEKLLKAMKKEMEEGAVAQTASGVTVASGMNPGDVAKRAADLKKQTGDTFTVLDTKSGTRRKI